MLKICFIGLGSIGKRHIKDLACILEGNCEYTIDAIRKKIKELPPDINILIHSVYESIGAAPSDYDVMFITNPTSMHLDTIKEAVTHTKHMFIEKPVFQFPIEDINELNLIKGNIYYVAAPLRYGAVISKIKEMLEGISVYSVRAISSSYLPEWRKGIDYRDNYSAHKDMGGGVALDIIHEIDYLTYLFGMPEECSYYGGKYSNLEIDSDDLGTYLLKYSDKIIEVHLDYFGRKTIRTVELYCDEYTIVGDLVNNILKKVFSDHDELIEIPPDEDFMNEMRYFLAMVQGASINENSIEHANDVLKIALGKYLT